MKYRSCQYYKSKVVHNAEVTWFSTAYSSLKLIILIQTLKKLRFWHLCRKIWFIICPKISLQSSWKSNFCSYFLCSVMKMAKNGWYCRKRAKCEKIYLIIAMPYVLMIIWANFEIFYPYFNAQNSLAKPSTVI